MSDQAVLTAAVDAVAACRSAAGKRKLNAADIVRPVNRLAKLIGGKLPDHVGNAYSPLRVKLSAGQACAAVEFEDLAKAIESAFDITPQPAQSKGRNGKAAGKRKSGTGTPKATQGSNVGR